MGIIFGCLAALYALMSHEVGVGQKCNILWKQLNKRYVDSSNLKYCLSFSDRLNPIHVRQKQNGTDIIIISNQLGQSQWFPCHEHSGFQVAKIIFFYVGVFGEKPQLEEPPKWAQVKDFPKLS